MGMIMDRYKLEQSAHPGKWVCTDKINQFIIVFEEHKFNETQEIKFFENEPDNVMEIAKMLREMADWLGENHYNKIF